MDSRVQKVSTAAKEAFKEMAAMQRGEKLRVRTGEDAIDSHLGGMIPGDVVLIGGNSGSGKSLKLYRILDKLFDIEVNPKAGNFVGLEFSMEMRMINKLLRKAHELTNKKKSKILSEEFTEDEKELLNKYNDSLKDDRRYVCQEPVSVEDFVSITRDFLKLHKDKEAVFISVDHLLLFLNLDKSKALQIVTDEINKMKLEFKNAYFILLTQLNRTSTITGGSNRDNSIMPTTDWIYGSSTMEFLSDYIVILMNPFRAGIDEYLKFNPDRYEYLSRHFAGEDKKGKQSFSTLGKMFSFSLKARESDNMFNNIFIEDMKLSDEVREKMVSEYNLRKEEREANSLPDLSAPPQFDSTKSNAMHKASWGKSNNETPF